MRLVDQDRSVWHNGEIRAGLELLAGLEDLLGHSHRLAAVRGELAHRAGDAELAYASYRRAHELCANEVERAHLRARLIEIETPGSSLPTSAG